MAADFSWTPPLAVLALGIVAGAGLVAMRSRSRHRPSEAEPSPASSQTSDLQRRYDALIRRLAEGVSAEERGAIELQAAQVLRDMESPVPSRGSEAAASQSPAAASPVRPTSPWVGFVYGVITMGVLGGLFFFASAGSSERPEGGSPTGGNGMGAAADLPQTSAADDAALKALEGSVQKTPADISQRIELTRAYVRRRDLMKVFDQTKAVLEIEPGNPYALTYQGLVRVAMGQADQAETMLTEAIKKDPTIEDAYIHLAMARLQQGNRPGAEQAIKAGQQQFPEDKELLAQVFAQIASETDAPGGANAPPPHPDVATEAASQETASVAPSGIVVVVDVPKGVSIPASAILFVIVREAGAETGPPAAVKRVPAAGFPITVTLSEKDSMSGESMPGLVRIEARIDRDGDPMTKNAADPIASEDNVRPGAGQILLVLTPGRN